MDTITIAVRWCCVPQAHINFVTDGITKWYMSRWIYNHSKTENLTIICVQVEFKRVSAYIQQLLSVMKALWVEPGRGSMEWEALDTLLDDTPLVPVSTNKYSVTHTTITQGDSFYDHVCNTVEFVKGCAWILRRELTIADKMTILKLHNKHEPHSVTVLVPGTATRMIHVRCTEPQRIHELFKKYDLTCSNVWDSRTSLSATAPCTALCDHNMTTVKANRIAETDALDQEPEVSNFYHDMKCVRIQAKLNALKHRPYSTHHRSVVDAAQLPSASVDGTYSNETQPELVSVVLYYYDRMATLGDVIKADGRFVPDVQYSNPEEWSGDRYVLELEPDNNVTIMGTVLPASLSDERTRLEPYTCPYCLEDANAYLDCGHLCCVSCTRRAKKKKKDSVACGVCKQESTGHRALEIPQNFDSTCFACCKGKEWVTECGHLICVKCFIGRCPVCSNPVTTLKRVFMSY